MVVGALNEEEEGVRDAKEVREGEGTREEVEGSFESKRGVTVPGPADLCPGTDSERYSFKPGNLASSLV